MTFHEATPLEGHEVPSKKANSQTKNPYSVVLLWSVNPVWLPGAHQNAVSSISSAGEGEEI